jgi:hypothetical protein
MIEERLGISTQRSGRERSNQPRDLFRLINLAERGNNATVYASPFYHFCRGRLSVRRSCCGSADLLTE